MLPLRTQLGVRETLDLTTVGQVLPARSRTPQSDGQARPITVPGVAIRWMKPESSTQEPLDSQGSELAGQERGGDRVEGILRLDLDPVRTVRHHEQSSIG